MGDYVRYVFKHVLPQGRSIAAVGEFTSEGFEWRKAQVQHNSIYTLRVCIPSSNYRPILARTGRAD